MSRPIRIGSRTSPLARAQADHVAALLAERGVESTFVGVTTTGDTDRRALTEIGGTGVFASAVRDALHAQRIDVAVHSLKDLPTAAEDGLEVAAVPAREDTRDVLVGLRLSELADQTRVGTGAPRRALQLTDYAQAHDIAVEVVPVRGNVDTRLDLVRSGTVHAVVLAAAGLRRLDRLSRPALDPVRTGAADLESTDDRVIVGGDLVGEILGDEVMLPAPGQGALGLEIHSLLSDDLARSIRALDVPSDHVACLAERAFLAELEAGCTAPVGAHAVVKSVRGTSADLTLAAVIGRTIVSNSSEPTENGPPVRVRRHGSSVDPVLFGEHVASEVLTGLRAIQRTRR